MWISPSGSTYKWSIQHHSAASFLYLCSQAKLFHLCALSLAVYVWNDAAGSEDQCCLKVAQAAYDVSIRTGPPDNRQTTDFRQLHSVVDFEHPGFRGPSSLTVSGITSVPKTRMTHSRARWPSFVSSRQGPSVAGFSSACPCRWRYRALSGYKPRMKK